MKIETIDDGIRAVLKLGYKNPKVGRFCVTLRKGNSLPIEAVAIEDESQSDRIYYEGAELDIEKKGDIRFNGVSFEEWKRGEV